MRKKYNVWFDDFSVGFGACGELDHDFESCTDRVSKPPKLSITLIKPSSKNTDGVGAGHGSGVEEEEEEYDPSECEVEPCEDQGEEPIQKI
ncbi:hypothetical protein V2J09_022588 [Rumex salicifolius]